MRMNRWAKFLVTGYSLGGALATLAALEIKQLLQPSSIKLYTFGQPRVGNDAFARYVESIFSNGEYNRITHANDLMVNTPARLLAF